MVLETVAVSFPDTAGTAVRYMEDVELESATRLCAFGDNLFEGKPAAAANEFGRGAAYYLAAFMEEPTTGRLLDMALARAGVAPGPRSPKWVEVVRRGPLTFAINHSRAACEVTIPGAEAVTGEWRDGVARLAPYGVCIVREGRA